jgi:hypothetical protein
MQIQNPDNRESIAGFIAELLLNKSMSSNLRKKMIHHLLWSATCDSDEGNSVDDIKYKKLYWSKKAVESYNNYGPKGLRHEHIVPQKIIKELMNKVVFPSFEEILNILNSYHFAAIITMEEDGLLNTSRMPNNDYIRDKTDKSILARYIDAEISLFLVAFDGNTPHIIESKLSYDQKGVPIINIDI